MLELVIAACLTAGPCRDFSLLYDPREVPLTMCVAAGQVEGRRALTAAPAPQKQTISASACARRSSAAISRAAGALRNIAPRSPEASRILRTVSAST
jgi:hypothetical protein